MATRFAARVADGQASGLLRRWRAVPSAALGPDADLEWHVAARGDHVELRVGELAASDSDQHHAEFRFALESGGSRVALELRETVLTLRGEAERRFDSIAMLPGSSPCSPPWRESLPHRPARRARADPIVPCAQTCRAIRRRKPCAKARRKSGSWSRSRETGSGCVGRCSVPSTMHHAALVAALIRRRALREHWQERDAGIVPEAVVVQPERGVSLGNVAETLDHGLAQEPHRVPNALIHDSRDARAARNLGGAAGAAGAVARAGLNRARTAASRRPRPGSP